jgi:DNA-binding phage protein
VRRDQKAAEPRYRDCKSAVGGLQGAQGRASEMRRMPLTRSFKEFVEIRIERDPKFRQALFAEAVQTLIEGDVETAKSVLRDYINATIGFPALAKATRMPPKSLMRMFGPKGNPTAVNLFGVIVALQERTGVHLEVRAVAA